MHGSGYRRNGGFGFAISEPSVTVKFQKTDSLEIIDNRAFGFDGDETARLLDILQKEILQKKFTNSCKIEIIVDT